MTKIVMVALLALALFLVPGPVAPDEVLAAPRSSKYEKKHMGI